MRAARSRPLSGDGVITFQHTESMGFASMRATEPVSVAVVGLGYVGCVTGACLAELGHRIIGVEKDQHKVTSVNEGRAPFYEPGLEDLVQRNVAAGRLSATTSMAEGVDAADIMLLCVGTPSERNGNIGLEQLRRVSEDIGRSLQGRSKPLIVAVRSTVFPGTCNEVVRPALGAAATVSIVAHPEFLREGSAVKDFFEPSLIVVGGDDRYAAARVAALYSPLSVEPSLVSLGAAELVKYACNAFHAVKIGFANEIGTVAAQLGIDPLEVMDTFCRDNKLNISRAYLKPGFAFGGSCLPKDLRALVYRASRLDIELPLINSVLISNQRHLERALQAVLDLPVERIGVFGLAFKENTDDLRESPVVALIEQLLGKGRQVRIFDPHIRLDQIYGSNRNFVIQAIPHIGRLMEDQLAPVLQWAEYLVLTQTPGAELKRSITASGVPFWSLSECRPSAAAGNQ